MTLPLWTGVVSTALAAAASYVLWIRRGSVKDYESEYAGGFLAGLMAGVGWVAVLAYLAGVGA